MLQLKNYLSFNKKSMTKLLKMLMNQKINKIRFKLLARTFRLPVILSIGLIFFQVNFMAPALAATTKSKSSEKKKSSESIDASDILESAKDEIQKIQNKTATTNLKSQLKKTKKSKSLTVKSKDSTVSEVSGAPSNLNGAPENAKDVGIFALSEPKLKITDRTWNYLLGLKAQQIKPKGRVHTSIVGDFDLSKYDHQVLPSLEFGVTSKLSDLFGGVGAAADTSQQLWFDSGSATLQVGYNSYVVPVSFESGYKAPDSTRFKTLLLNVLVEGESQLTVQVPLNYKMGLSIGKFYYTQTSLNDYAQFSEGLVFGSLNLGLNYFWFDNVSVSGDYIYRTPLQVSSIDLQNHNFELGLRIQW